MSKETSESIASIAAVLMQHEDERVRKVAASCLTQHELDESKPGPFDDTASYIKIPLIEAQPGDFVLLDCDKPYTFTLEDEDMISDKERWPVVERDGKSLLVYVTEVLSTDI